MRIPAIALALAVVAAPVCASAHPAYTATAWTTEKGLPPGDIFAIGEDRAGYLWLGTASGLVRFDGLEFESWGRGDQKLPGTAVPALVGTRDGSVWVGFGDAGGVARIRDGKLLHYYADHDGLDTCTVTALLEDRAGVLWAGCQRGLAMFDGRAWKFVGPEHQLPAEGGVSSLYEDRHGSLWVAAATGVFRRSAGQDTFELIDRNATYAQGLTEDDGDNVWVTDSHRIAYRLGGADSLVLGPDVRLPSAGWRLLHDQRDAIWIAALGGGLLRLNGTGGTGARRAVERINYETTITGSPRALFEDHEHNIWVGMRGGGLLRLAETGVTTGVALDGLTNDGVRAMAAAPDGSVWIATGHSLNKFSGTTRTVSPLSQTLALHVDRQGTLWAVTAEALGMFTGGQFHPVSLPASVRLERTAAITTDFDGTVWLCTLEQGVFTLRGRVIAPAGGADVAGRGCSYAYTDSHGRVWLGFARGGAAYYDGRFHPIGQSNGLTGGAVIAITEDSSGDMWFATSTGLGRFSDGRFATVMLPDGVAGKLNSALIEDGEGQMWLGANAGGSILKFVRRDADVFAADRPRRELQYTLYDASDGLQSPTHWASRPAVVRDGTGQLWFATGNGVAVIDPRRPPAVHRPSAPRVARIMMNGSLLDPSAALTIPNLSSIAVTYSAVSLSAGSKIRFRYMLEGLTNTWTDAGVTRAALFENLPAGRYRFRVAATTDGVWTENDGALEFAVRPPFYQTLSFYALLATFAMLAAWAYWQLRLRAIRQQFALVVAERARVSREIHDTLLQSLGAVGLELEIVASQLGASEAPASGALTRLRREVTRCIREARESIWELRSSRFEARDLASALEDLAEDVGTARAVQVDVETSGRPRRKSPETDEQLLRIAQEAVGNAVRHGRAKRVRVSLDYTPQAVSLRVADDGCGFVPAEQRPDGEHWGLTNMRERAQRVGGHLTIRSGSGEGTIVETVVPDASGL